MRASAIIGIWLMLFFPICRGAEEVRDLESEFIVETLQTEQGLPDNFVNSITQTPEGYLWVATFNGLARYNGVGFVSFDSANTPELPSSRITRLELDGGGRLWIRNENSRLSSWSGGRFRLWGPGDGLPENGAIAMQKDRERNLITASHADHTNYFRFNGERFEQFEGERPMARVFGNMQDRRGIGWTINDHVWPAILNSSDTSAAVAAEVPRLVKGKGWRLLGARDGGLWVLAGGFQKFKDGRWEYWADFPFETDQFGAFAEDPQGNFWLGVNGGELWRLGTNRVVTRFKLAEARISEVARAMFFDAENNFWIGTGGSGLLRLKARALRNIDSRAGLSADVTRSVTQDREGRVWVATVNTVDRLDANGNVLQKRAHTEMALPWIVHAPARGGLWVGTYNEGPFYFGGGEMRRLKIGATDAWPWVNNCFLEARDGSVYLGTGAGLFLAEGTNLVSIGPAPQRQDVRAMAEDGRGNIYSALNGGGLLEKSGSGWRAFTMKDGLPSDHLYALSFDRRGNLWIAAEGHGLCRFKDGKLVTIAESATALPRFINCIVEDDLERLWVGSNRGIFRADLDELIALTEGRGASVTVNRYERSDGMGSSQCTGGACKTKDGKLWFTTMNGVAMIDPTALPHNSRPPPVVIEETLVDDKAAARETGTLTIPPGAHRVEIRFAGLSYTAPDRVRFRYRLENADGGWMDSSRPLASYTSLAPGAYNFRVQAANNDGVWNEAGATLGVVVRPFLWQRTSARVVAGILLVAVAIGLARYWSSVRLRRRLAELERRHALDRERGRISRDLHDSLGADLSQLALWSELTVQEQDRPAAMAERAKEVSALTREVIQNVEEIVWTVNPRNDSLDSFVSYLCEFSERTITRAGLRFRWEAPEQIPAVPLPSDIRHHLLLATKEALNNIVKHAGATEARLGVFIHDLSLEIVISDDGRGFDEATPSNRNGLKNLRERLAACRGRLTVQSKPKEGTSLSIEIPLRSDVDK